MRHHRNHKHSNGKSSFALGALVGGLVGGITALLFAPKSGEKMRRDLANTYSEMSEKACHLMENVCDQTCDFVERAKDLADDAKHSASKAIRSRRK